MCPVQTVKPTPIAECQAACLVVRNPSFHRVLISSLSLPHASICATPHHPSVGSDVSRHQSGPRTNFAALVSLPAVFPWTARGACGSAAARTQLAGDPFTVRISLIATGWLFLGYVLQTVGLRFTTASNSAFITVLYVVFVPLYLRRLGLQTWLSNGIALIGLWFLVRPTASANLGDLMTLASAAAFAAHMVCLERYTRVADPVSLFLWQFLFMTLALCGAMWWEHPTASMFKPIAVVRRLGRDRRTGDGRVCRADVGATAFARSASRVVVRR